MTQKNIPSFPITADGKSFAPAPEHSWLSNGSTLNPSPGSLLKQRRDTAEGCRERAAAFLLEAVTEISADSRRILESTAAAWKRRAEMFERGEAKL